MGPNIYFTMNIGQYRVHRNKEHFWSTIVFVKLRRKVILLYVDYDSHQNLFHTDNLGITSLQILVSLWAYAEITYTE